MNAIIDKIQQWDYYQTLPETILGFKLSRTLRQQDSKLFLFEYQCPEHRSLYALYDKATKEYKFHTVTGLFDFCDIDSIAADLPDFELVLKKSLVPSLEALACFDKSRLGSVFCSKGILDKDWSLILPLEELGFKLFIPPNQPVKIVNGSFIIIDYCDFAAQSNLTVYYNIYRDEFFAERRINRLPEIVTDFDSKTVETLADKLAGGLITALAELRNLVNSSRKD